MKFNLVLRINNIEMVEIKNKNDPITRRTLWNAYNKKCFYCNNPIPYNNFQVDHLIPKSLEKEEAIILYDLQEDFELNSYYNLVPTCFTCNSRKRDAAYEKKTILFYLEEIKKNIPKIKLLEEEFKEMDKKSELSAAFSTALKDLSLPDILTIITEQELKSYQKKILQSTIENISKLSIENVLDLLNQKNLSDEGIALSVLAVIEPIEYNMADGNVFYKDFGFIFWSTSEMLRNKVEQGTKSFLNEITTKILIHVELDDIINRLKELSIEHRSDYEYMFEIIQNFLNILIFTTQNGRIIHMLPFSIMNEKGEFFWLYIGSQEFKEDEIIRKHNIKRDYWIQEGSSNLKNSFIIIASEI